MEKFSFFAPLDKFEKSVNHGKNGVIDVKLDLLISSSRSDFDSEEVGQDGLIMDLWKAGFGRIKYEHNTDPKYFVGFPTGVLRKGMNTYAEGRLFATPGTPQYDMTLQCIGDLENVQAWNLAHPESPKKIGVSIEGGVIAKKGKKILKSVVTNIVLTANPRNYDTYATIMKSLEAGTNFNPGDMQGGEAGRVQHIAGTYKSQTIGVNQMKFKSESEVEKYLTDQGVPEAEAKTKAAAWKAAQEKSSKRNADLEKSLSIVSETIDGVYDLVESLNGNKEMEVLEKSFQSSIPAPGVDDISPIPFLKAIGESSLTIQKSMTKQNAEIAKIHGVEIGLIGQVLEMFKSVVDDVTTLTEKTDEVMAENLNLRKAINDKDMGVVTDALGNIVVAGKKEGEGDPPVKVNRLAAKAVLRKSFEDAQKNDDITKAKTYSDAITMIETLGFDALSKSLQEEVKAALK